MEYESHNMQLTTGLNSSGILAKREQSFGQAPQLQKKEWSTLSDKQRDIKGGRKDSPRKFLDRMRFKRQN